MSSLAEFFVLVNASAPPMLSTPPLVAGLVPSPDPVAGLEVIVCSSLDVFRICDAAVGGAAAALEIELDVGGLRSNLLDSMFKLVFAHIELVGSTGHVCSIRDIELDGGRVGVFLAE